jgi:hypothetical protein
MKRLKLEMTTSTRQKSSFLLGIIYMVAPIVFIFLVLFIVRSFGSWVGVPNIFETSTCEAPCWNGIAPGVTSREEALQILEGINAVYQTRISSDTADHEYSGLFERRIIFEIQNNNLRSVHGTIFLFEDHVAAMIIDDNLNLSVSEAVELFGEPDYVLIINYWGYVVGFLQNESGIYFSYDPWGGQISNEDNISHNTMLTRLIFFDPEMYSPIADSGMFSQGSTMGDAFYESLTPWCGYGSISEIYLHESQ